MMERQEVENKRNATMVLEKLHHKQTPAEAKDLVYEMMERYQELQPLEAEVTEKHKANQELRGAQEWAIMRELIHQVERMLIKDEYTDIEDEADLWEEHQNMLDRHLAWAHLPQIATEGTKGAQAEKEAAQIAKIAEEAAEEVNREEKSGAQGGKKTKWERAIKKVLTKGVESRKSFEP